MNLIEAIRESSQDDVLTVKDSSYGGFKITGERNSRIAELSLLLVEISKYGYEHLMFSGNWQIERKPLVWEGEH